MAGSSTTKKGQTGGGRLPPKRGQIKVAILKKFIGVFTIHAKNKNNKDASSSSTALLLPKKPSTTSKMAGSSATKKGQAGGVRLPPKRRQIRVAILKKVLGVFTIHAKNKNNKDASSSSTALLLPKSSTTSKMAGSSATKKGQAGGVRLPPKRRQIRVAILKKVLGVFTIHAKNKNNKDASSSSTALLLPKSSTTSKMAGSSATKKGQAGGVRLPPKRGQIKVAILKKVIGLFTIHAKNKNKKDASSSSTAPLLPKPSTTSKITASSEEDA